MKIDTVTNTITIEHRMLSGQTHAPVAYLTCNGQGGMQSQAILFVTGSTGRYIARNVNNEGQVRFDLPPEEYAKPTAPTVTMAEAAAEVKKMYDEVREEAAEEERLQREDKARKRPGPDL